MKTADPLEQAEKTLQELHQVTRHSLHPAHKKYPLIFLFLITFSVAAVFHGLDKLMDESVVLEQHPIFLVLLGIIGLFITGSLYKRLGKDKYE